MGYVVDQSLPRFIVRGENQTLTLDVYDDSDNSQVTVSSGTFTLYSASKELATGAVTVGPPASYALANTSTDGESLSTQLIEVWDVVIAGEAHKFRRTAYLVRYPLYPVLRQSDVLEEHPQLLAMGGSDLTDLTGFINAAWKKLVRRIISNARSPQLIQDNWALYDIHLAMVVYQMATYYTTFDPMTWDKLRELYKERVEEEWERLTFRYDTDKDGFVSHTQSDSGAGVVWLNTSYEGLP